jgi:hypothetical protein
MKRNSCKIWVDPNFKEIIKIKAVENNISVIKYTSELAKELRKNQKKQAKIFEEFRLF